jgi:hypothetical protein
VSREILLSGGGTGGVPQALFVLDGEKEWGINLFDEELLKGYFRDEKEEINHWT